jgi:hypothetical protein
MESTIFITLFATLAVLIGGVSSLAQYFDLYWQVPFLDSALHLLTGFLIGLFYVAIRQFCFKTKRSFNWFYFLCFILVVGGVWEYGEVYMGVNNMRFSGYATDTLLDLVCDSAGALLSIYFTKAVFKEIL